MRQSSKRTIRADDLRGLREFLADASSSLVDSDFSDDDIDALRVSVRELVDNVGRHVRNDGQVSVGLDFEEGLRYNYHEGVCLTVSDEGLGFDFENTLQGLEAELMKHGTEHGLLRASRLGSALFQESVRPHVMVWLKEKSPDVRQVGFAGRGAVPFVFTYRHEAIRIAQNVHTFYQFESYLGRCPAFMSLVLDPLRRSDSRFIGVEILGQGWTGVLSWQAVMDSLMLFLDGRESLDKTLLVYADTGPSEQDRLREYCQGRRIKMFEDATTIPPF